MNTYLSNETVWLLLPEILLIALAVWTYVGGAFISWRGAFQFMALVTLAVVAVVLYRQDVDLVSRGLFTSDIVQSSGPLVIDYLGHAARWVAFVIGVALVMLASRASSDELSTEYLGSLLLVIAGMMLVCVAGDLILLFLALELISIPTYILLFLGRRDATSQEATAKYFFLSILSSALLLYGLSFLYGLAGTTDLHAIRTRMLELSSAGDPMWRLAPVALLLVLGGAAFKLAAVPLHFYAPDVYQGTTSGNAGVLAVAPKLAGLIVLVRLVVVAMPGIESIGWQLILIISLATMTLGNVLALWQQNIRRLLAYSSIAHAGYMLMGLAVALAIAQHGRGADLVTDGVAASLFYLLVYVMATLGAFAVLTFLGSRAREVNEVDELAGLGKTRPVMAIAMAVFMLSLTGIPPLAGFWGKLTLFLSALSVTTAFPETWLGTWFLVLAVVAALNAAISAGYYLRVVGVMYFREPAEMMPGKGGPGAWLVGVAAALLVVTTAFLANGLMADAHRASRSVRLVDVSPPRVVTSQEPSARTFNAGP